MTKSILISVIGSLTLMVSLISSPLFAEDQKKNTGKQAEEMLEKNLALIWGKRREVKVVQRREFIKDGKLDFNL